MEFNKLSKGLTGIAGEYYAAAELSIRNYMAAITLRNNDSVDILACRQSDLKTFSIQVKTIQTKAKRWPLNKKVENLRSENLFYIFVQLKQLNQRPDFHIVPSWLLADKISSEHSEWVKMPGRNNQMRNENDMRVFNGKENQFLERWDFIN